MAEERSGKLEMGAKMDYVEHEKTYDLFLAISKWTTVFTVSLLIAMAFGFFTSAGFFSATILLIILCAAGFIFLK
jgi:hypothetical protein